MYSYSTLPFNFSSKIPWRMPIWSLSVMRTAPSRCPSSLWCSGWARRRRWRWVSGRAGAWTGRRGSWCQSAPGATGGRMIFFRFCFKISLGRNCKNLSLSLWIHIHLPCQLSLRSNLIKDQLNQDSDENNFFFQEILNMYSIREWSLLNIYTWVATWWRIPTSILLWSYCDWEET